MSEQDEFYGELRGGRSKLAKRALSHINYLNGELKAARAKLAALESQEPVAKVEKSSATGAGIDTVLLDQFKEGTTFLYPRPAPAQPAVAVPDVDSALEEFFIRLGGSDSDAWHDYPADQVFRDGFSAGLLAVAAPEGWRVDFSSSGYGEIVVTEPDGTVDVFYEDETANRLLRLMLAASPAADCRCDKEFDGWQQMEGNKCDSCKSAADGEKHE